MQDLKIAVMPSCLDRDFDRGLEQAAQLGVQGVHLSSWYMLSSQNPQALSPADVLSRVRAHGLEVSAISGSGVGVDFTEREKHDAIREGGRWALNLAVELECGLWQDHVGVMPWDTDDPKWQAVVDIAGDLAEMGEEIGATLCLETGPEPPRVLHWLMQTINSPALGINYDPANLIIWPVMLAEQWGLEWTREWAEEHFDPHAGAELLGPWIRHTHAKDALVQDDGSHLEVPLGQGWVDWPRYVGILQAAGFDGYFAIEREVGENRFGDALGGVEFLRSLGG